MQTFFLIWLGQLASLLGSNLTEFALGVWAFQETGSVTQFAFIVLLIYLPNVLISPIAGAIIDRYNRRWAMIFSDIVSSLASFVVLLLVWGDNLAVWHIYWVVMVVSVANAIQLPAYSAAIAQIVPPSQYSRANGMVQASRAIAKIISPLLAGFLLTLINLSGILLIDFATFSIAITTLLFVRIPDLHSSPAKTLQFREFWKDIKVSWNYISTRVGLRQLLSFIAVTYFTLGMLEVLLWSFMLNTSTSQDLGLVLSIGGVGMLLGSGIMSLWGGPKGRVSTILLCVAWQGGLILLCGIQASTFIIGIGIFGYLFAQPILISCNQAIWQSKVPQELQGRIFALQQMLERTLSILAYIIVGPLVEGIFAPLLSENQFWANIFDKILRTDSGQEIALVWILVGMINIIAVLIASQQPRLRSLEVEMPDAKIISPYFKKRLKS